MPSEITPVADAAAMVGIDRSTARKFLVKHGFQMVAIRGEGSQKVNGLSKAELARFLEMRESAGYGGVREIAEAAQNYIYVIQPDPEMRPKRFKVGITVDLAGRLASFRCIAPEAKLVRKWQAPAICEGFAHAVARALGEQVGVEVFDLEEPARLLVVLDDAFQVFGGGGT